MGVKRMEAETAKDGGGHLDGLLGMHLSEHLHEQQVQRTRRNSKEK